jgi:hypothetical protein
VSALDEVAGHGLAHDSKTDETDVAHKNLQKDSSHREHRDHRVKQIMEPFSVTSVAK